VIIYLVRHCRHALLNTVLCGRIDGLALSPEGAEQARRLADQFSGKPIDLVQTSPRQRARETAQPIAAAAGRRLDKADGMDELDAGEWSGRSFERLAADPSWVAWNENRACTRPPGGESMIELQARVVAHLKSVGQTNARSVVVVSHAEPIRAALLHCLDLPVDRFAEIEIEPGSISILRHDGEMLVAEATNLQVLS